MSTLSADSGVRGQYPSLVGGNGTGILVFPAVGGPSFNDGGNQLPTPTGSMFTFKPAQVILRSPAYEGQAVVFKMAGYITIGTSSATAELSLYSGSSLSAASDVLVASATSASLAAGTYPFTFQITGQATAGSGKMQFGSASCYINGVSTSVTIANSGLLTLANPLTTTDAPFVASCQFGTGYVGNVAALQQMTAEN